MKSRMIPVLCILMLFLTACQKQAYRSEIKYY